MTLFFVGRLIFGLCLMLAWTMSSWHLLSPEEMPYSYGLPAKRGRIPRRAIAIVGTGSLVYVSLVVAFVMQIAPTWTGIGIIVTLGVMRQFERATWDTNVVVELGKYVPAIASLTGYVFVRLVSSETDPMVLERYAWEGGCGVMAGAFFAAGIEKFLQGGGAWFTKNGLPLMLAERIHMGPMWLRWIRRRLLAMPTMGATIGGLTNVAEIGGVLFAVPSIRWWMLGYMEIMLAGIALLLGYLEVEWLLVFVALTFMTMGLPLG